MGFKIGPFLLFAFIMVLINCYEQPNMHEYKRSFNEFIYILCFPTVFVLVLPIGWCFFLWLCYSRGHDRPQIALTLERHWCAKLEDDRAAGM